VETVRTWLTHDARIDEAARALGIHRHTVRARVAQAQQLLGWTCRASRRVPSCGPPSSPRVMRSWRILGADVGE
jgi:hypothetical protein